MATVESRVRLVEYVPARGVDFFEAACRHDLEGIVAKWKDGTYQSGPKTSWLKIRNPGVLAVRSGESCSRRAATMGLAARLERPRVGPRVADVGAAQLAARQALSLRLG